MDDLIESSVESAVSGVLAALLSFIIANIGVVLVFIGIAAGIWLIYNLYSKRKDASQLSKRAIQLLRETESRLQELLVSDTFKELELGLMQGVTANRMQGMEQVAYTLLDQSQQLGKKLSGQSVALGAMEDAPVRAHQVMLEAEDLWRRTNQYLNDLSSMRDEVRGAAQDARQLESRLAAISDQLEVLAEQTGSPLEELQSQFEHAQQQFKQADQLAAFDAVRAGTELHRVHIQVNQLQLSLKRAAAELQRERNGKVDEE